MASNPSLMRDPNEVQIEQIYTKYLQEKHPSYMKAKEVLAKEYVHEVLSDVKPPIGTL